MRESDTVFCGDVNLLKRLEAQIVNASGMNVFLAASGQMVGGDGLREIIIFGLRCR